MCLSTLFEGGNFGLPNTWSDHSSSYSNTHHRIFDGIKSECELELTSTMSIFLSRSCISFVDLIEALIRIAKPVIPIDVTASTAAPASIPKAQGGLPRAMDGTGLPLAVRPGQRNPGTAAFGSDGGPYGVGRCFSRVGRGV